MTKHFDDFKLGVIGSRNFDDFKLLSKYLDKIHSVEPITWVVSGGANGADKLGELWANDNYIPTMIFKPDWKKYKKSAGFIRNKEIISNSDKVIAFWDGKSKGTKHSIDLCEKLDKKCKIVYTDKKFIRSMKLKQIFEKIEKNRFTLDI